MVLTRSQTRLQEASILEQLSKEIVYDAPRSMKEPDFDVMIAEKYLDVQKRYRDNKKMSDSYYKFASLAVIVLMNSPYTNGVIVRARNAILGQL